VENQNKIEEIKQDLATGAAASANETTEERKMTETNIEKTEMTTNNEENMHNEAVIEKTRVFVKKYDRKCFAVETKCGHVGRNNCIIITFPIKAASKKEAAARAKALPRVKRDHKDAIRNVEEIDYKKYRSLLAENNRNPYLTCKNVQEQRSYPEIEAMIEPDICNLERRDIHKRKKADYAYRMRKLELHYLSNCEEFAA